MAFWESLWSPNTSKGPLPDPKLPIKGVASVPFEKGLPD